MIVSGFSQRAAGAIFVLAYALKDNADGNYVFDMPHDAVSLEDISYDSLSERFPTTNRAHAPMPNTNNNAEEARAYSYLAASLLRLFRTNEDNYIGAFNHIVTGYSRFYNRQMPIFPPQPTLEGIRTLSHYFSHCGVFKATLFRILYCGGGTKNAEGLRSFLYENHLSNTGMHIWSIFGSLVDKLNCKPGVILSALQKKEYEQQLSCLETMLELAERSDGLHKRRMWRYGRLFDEAFMLPLQTKHCRGLAYILASALKRIEPVSNQNILNITQFKDLSMEKRNYLAAVGENLIKYVTHGII